MKRNGHKHKESFSILMISNTGQHSTGIHLSQTAVRLLAALAVFLLAAACAAGFALAGNAGQARLEQLQARLDASQAEQTQLAQENRSLEQELNALREKETAQEDGEDETPSDPDLPSRYPASGRSTILTPYSEQSPFLSISMNQNETVAAAGNGTVVQVTSDETYPVMIEIEHKNGYTTRYLCHQAAEVSVEQGASVQAGDTLFTVTAADTQFDYQILDAGDPIDPLTIIDAKG